LGRPKEVNIIFKEILVKVEIKEILEPVVTRITNPKEKPPIPQISTD